MNPFNYQGPVGPARLIDRRSELDDLQRAAGDRIAVPRALHEADGGLTVVCFDEFQDVLIADDALDGLVRSVIQHHGEAAAYVFAGSQPSLMHALFAEHERPFYGQARPPELPALPIAEAAHDIEALLVADGLDPGGAVDELLAYTGGHPQRTILLAHHLYNLLEQRPDRWTPRPRRSNWPSRKPKTHTRRCGMASTGTNAWSCSRWATAKPPLAASSPASTASHAPRFKRHSNGCLPTNVISNGTRTASSQVAPEVFYRAESGPIERVTSGEFG